MDFGLAIQSKIHNPKSKIRMANVIANTPSARVPAFGLYHDEWGQLVLIDADGARHVGVTPVRMFPFSDPDRWLSITDGAGREIVCIEELSDLSPQIREVLETDLSRREFVPVLRRIVRVSSILEPCEWLVETDRAPRRCNHWRRLPRRPPL